MATSSVCLTVRPVNDVTENRLTLTVHHSGDSRIDAGGGWCPPSDRVKRGLDVKVSVDRRLPITPIFNVPGYDGTGPSKTRKVENVTVLADRYAFLEVKLLGNLNTNLSGASRVRLKVQVDDRFQDLGKTCPNLEQVERCVDCFSALLEERFQLPRGEFVDVSKAPVRPLYDALSGCMGVIEEAPDLGDPFANLLATLPFLDREKLGQVSEILAPYMKGDGDATKSAGAMLEELIGISEVEHITPEMTAPTALERAATSVARMVSSAWAALRGED